MNAGAQRTPEFPVEVADAFRTLSEGFTVVDEAELTAEHLEGCRSWRIEIVRKHRHSQLVETFRVNVDWSALWPELGAVRVVTKLKPEALQSQLGARRLKTQIDRRALLIDTPSKMLTIAMRVISGQESRFGEPSSAADFSDWAVFGTWAAVLTWDSVAFERVDRLLNQFSTALVRRFSGSEPPFGEVDRSTEAAVVAAAYTALLCAMGMRR